MQVEESVRTYSAHLPIRSTTVYGGVNINPQTKALRAGVEILVADRLDVSDFCKAHGATQVPVEEMWARSDVVTIHLSKNSTTMGLYDGAVLDKIRKGAVLINLARGGMVDEIALKERMMSGHIAGASFDVFAIEPANGHELLDVPTFFESSTPIGRSRGSIRSIEGGPSRPRPSSLILRILAEQGVSKGGGALKAGCRKIELSGASPFETRRKRRSSG